MSREGRGEISIDPALAERHRAAERAQAEHQARKDAELAAGEERYAAKLREQHMRDRGVGLNPPPAAPLRVTCANRKCGSRASLRAANAQHEAAQHGGRLDADGTYWCSPRCLPEETNP